MLKSKWYFN